MHLLGLVGGAGFSDETGGRNGRLPGLQMLGGRGKHAKQGG